MKCFLSFLLFLCLTSSAHTEGVCNKIKPPAKVDNHDYAPEILSTFFQSIVPSFLQMIVAAETNDSDGTLQSLTHIAQGIGQIVDYGTRARSENPAVDIKEILLDHIARLKPKYLLKSLITHT